jgi:hypothetical protein
MSRVDSAFTKTLTAPEQDDNIFRLKTLHSRGLLISRRNVVLSQSRLRLLRVFHLPIRLDSPLRPRSAQLSYRRS